jgi:hypothetical protein
VFRVQGPAFRYLSGQNHVLSIAAVVAPHPWACLRAFCQLLHASSLEQDTIHGCQIRDSTFLIVAHTTEMRTPLTAAPTGNKCPILHAKQDQAYPLGLSDDTPSRTLGRCAVRVLRGVGLRHRRTRCTSSNAHLGTVPLPTARARLGGADSGGGSLPVRRLPRCPRRRRRRGVAALGLPVSRCPPLRGRQRAAL